MLLYGPRRKKNAHVRAMPSSGPQGAETMDKLTPVVFCPRRLQNRVSPFESRGGLFEVCARWTSSLSCWQRRR
eukprot:3889555-Pyramimonas_sp.AAC.1